MLVNLTIEESEMTDVINYVSAKGSPTAGVTAAVDRFSQALSIAARKATIQLMSAAAAPGGLVPQVISDDAKARGMTNARLNAILAIFGATIVPTPPPPPPIP